jgi:hypothetical protein
VYLKTIIMTAIMSLVLAGAALAQQDTNQSEGFLGIGGDQQEMQQTFTGIVDKAGDEHVLIVGDKAYQLDVDDEEMVEGMIGQEVEVRGTLEEETIQAESINPAGQMQQPMGGTGTEQPMSGTGTDTGIGTEQPMGGQEGNQTGW